MENKEIRRIIFESLLHKNITKVNYFNKQLEKSSIYPLIFAKCLLDELKNIDEYVNSLSFKAWKIDSNTGEKKYFKNIILLSKETEGKMMGQIDFRNINEIAKPLLEFCKIILNNDAQNSKQPKQQKKTSYVWQIDPDKELPELYRLMVNRYKLIAPETTYEQFKYIFTGQPIESIEPIKWIGTNRLLAYFLDSVFKGQNWQSIAGNGKLFKNKKNIVITANDLSVAKKGYGDYGLPKDYEKIDLILKTIKKD
jgi:hypothetical protein